MVFLAIFVVSGFHLTVYLGGFALQTCLLIQSFNGCGKLLGKIWFEGCGRKSQKTVPTLNFSTFFLTKYILYFGALTTSRHRLKMPIVGLSTEV